MPFITHRNLAEKYFIEQLVGESAAGFTYRAYDSQNQCVVAVKNLRPRYVRGREAFEHITRTGIAASALHHSNILEIYETLETDGQFALVQEWLAEGSLANPGNGIQPLTFEKTLDLMESTLDALAAAHSHHIIHGNLKPTNLLFDSSGNIKLADWGFLPHRVTDIAPETLSSTAPEIFAGVRPNVQTDLYAIASIFQNILLRHQSEWQQEFNFAAVADKDQAPELAARITFTIAKAIATEPRMRFAGAPEMRDAIRLARENTTTLSRTPHTAVTWLVGYQERIISPAAAKNETTASLHLHETQDDTGHPSEKGSVTQAPATLAPGPEGIVSSDESLYAQPQIATSDNPVAELTTVATLQTQPLDAQPILMQEENAPKENVMRGAFAVHADSRRIGIVVPEIRQSPSPIRKKKLVAVLTSALFVIGVGAIILFVLNFQRPAEQTSIVYTAAQTRPTPQATPTRETNLTAAPSLAKEPTNMSVPSNVPETPTRITTVATPQPPTALPYIAAKLFVPLDPSPNCRYENLETNSLRMIAQSNAALCAATFSQDYTNAAILAKLERVGGNGFGGGTSLILFGYQSPQDFFGVLITRTGRLYAIAQWKNGKINSITSYNWSGNLNRPAPGGSAKDDILVQVQNNQVTLSANGTLLDTVALDKYDYRGGKIGLGLLGSKIAGEPTETLFSHILVGALP